MMIKPIISLYVAVPIFILIMIFNIIFSYGPRRIVRGVILVLLFLINMRIMVYNDTATVYANNLDVIFCFDNTLSMAAKDGMKESRFDRAKEDVEYIVDNLTGSYYSLISYNDVSYLRIPLTKDASSFKASLKTMRIPNLTYANGTNVTIFKDNLEKVLESSSSKVGRLSIVFIIGDGENTSSDKLDSLSNLKKYITNGAVLGYGSSEGSTMEVESYQGSGYYQKVKDKDGQAAITKLDENNLKQIAGDLGIEYIHVDKTTDLSNLVEEVNKVIEVNETTKVYDYTDTYFYLSIIVVILLGVELYLDRREYL